uniref:Uncharacterized protein n=1 Tax=Meloidogyne enterolobii TaxID=390850 RepID=A0A6V7Y6W0_MELEN|nr:unnamed protein product [Meloidogyne enterolobii]
MLIYSKEGGKTVDDVLGGKNLNKFRIIEVPINPNRLDQDTVDEDEEDEAYNDFVSTPEFFLIGIYKEIIKNEVVYIDGVQIGIYDWLQQQIKDQAYSLGIAEFNQMAASFYVFKLLGIKNTFNVSVSVFFPGYLQFLEINGKAIDVTKHEVPEFMSAEPNEWIFNNDKCEFYWNQAEKIDIEHFILMKIGW